MKGRRVASVLTVALVFLLFSGLCLAGMAYQEAPELRVRVAAGELPPVGERLPKEPLVVEPVEEIGKYGGAWRFFIPAPKRTSYISAFAYEKLVRWDEEAKNIVPNVAKSWDVSEEGKVYTFSLREGMKWSDGQPFTADDFLFWYEDVVLNKELTPVLPEYLMIGGEPVQMKKLDDYTVEFRFAASAGLFLNALAYEQDVFRPKHYLQQFHPGYTSKDELEKMAKEEGFENWYQLFLEKDQFYWNHGLGYPVIEPWVLKSAYPSMQPVFERNPYYWKVDPAGNQLPYIDKVVNTVVEDPEVTNLKTMVGEADLQPLGLQFADYILFMESREKGDYRVLLWGTDIGSDITLFPNQNHQDPVLRKLIRDVRFRQALSLAINRDEINEVGYLGMGVSRQATVMSTSPYFKEEYAEAYAQYDSEEANSLLDEMGLTERDEEGFRLRPDGKTLSLVIITAGEQMIEADVLGLVEEYWEAIGIKTAYRPMERELFRSRLNAAEFDVGTWMLQFMQDSARLQVYEYYYAPLWNQWYLTQGVKGEEPSAEARKLELLYDETKITADPEKRKELYQKMWDLHAENVWMIGLVGEVPQIIVAKNNLRNVPEKSIYAWSMGHMLGLSRIEQFFFE